MPKTTPQLTPGNLCKNENAPKRALVSRKLGCYSHGSSEIEFCVNLSLTGRITLPANLTKR